MSAPSVACPLLVAAVAICVCGVCRADLIPLPPHPHAPVPPVVTWDDGHVPIPTHQHQHRTGHDPRAGVFNHGGAGAYVANKVWVGRELIRVGGAHPFPNEFAHGHQGHELPSGRYHVHFALPGGDIGVLEALAWNLNASADAAATVARWLAVGNAAGPANWPGVPDGAHDPAGGVPPPGAGVPWHSSIGWASVRGGPHEVHIELGEAGPGNAAVTNSPFGHTAAGAGAVTITMDDDVDWFYGGVGVGAAHQTDFFTVLLHEWGHVIGFSHFGTALAAYIMNGDPQPFFDGHLPGHPDLDGDGIPDVFPGAVIRAIDADAVHGVRDLYAICGPGRGGRSLEESDECCCAPVPEPSTLFLLQTGALGLFAYDWRRRKHPATATPT